jgi:hypothetical protein
MGEQARNGELRRAAQTVLDGLNARIEQAPDGAVPVFDGIADLHDALQAFPAAPHDEQLGPERRLAAAIDAERAAAPTGHNDDCLFCGVKDKVAKAALAEPREKESGKEIPVTSWRCTKDGDVFSFAGMPGWHTHEQRYCEGPFEPREGGKT